MKRTKSKSISRISNKTKKIWGGTDVRTNVVRPNGTNTNTVTPKTTLTSKVVSLGAKLGEKLASKGVDAVSNYLELDPDRTTQDIIKDVGAKVSAVRNAMNTPAGEKLMRDIGDVGEKIIESLEEPIRTAQNIGNEFLTEEVEALEKTGMDAIGIVPVVGEIVEGVRTGSDLVRAAENVVDVGAKLTGVGTDVINTLERQKKRVGEIYDEVGELAEKQTDNLMKNEQFGGAIRSEKKLYRNILKRITRSRNKFFGAKRKSRRHRRRS
jgi:hypothetical protein